MPSHKTKEAQRMRHLGRLIEAQKLMEDARSEEDSLPLAIEYSGVCMEQGRVADALNNIEDALHKFRPIEEDKAWIGVAEMLRAMLIAARTATFTKSFHLAIKVHNDYLLGRTPIDYDKKSIMILSSYLFLQSLAQTCGFEIEEAPPLPPQDQLEDIFDRIISTDEDSALIVARLYSTQAPAQEKLNLYKKFLHSGNTSLLNQAEAHSYLADLIRDVGALSTAAHHLERAHALFETAEHATGSLTIRVESISQNVNRETFQTARKDLTQLMCQLDNFGDFFGVEKASTALYKVAEIDQDDELRTQLDQEYIKRSEAGGYDQLWVSRQMLIVSRWQLEKLTDIPASIRWLEELYESVKDKEVPRLHFLIARHLSGLYRAIKKYEEATDWNCKAVGGDAIPRCSRFLYGLDPFYNNLRDLKQLPSNLTSEEEDASLRKELAQCIRDIELGSLPSNLKYFGMMKVMHYCNFYMSQFKFRTVDRVGVLVGICLEHSERLLQHIPAPSVHQLRGDILQVQARLLCTQSTVQGSNAILLLQTAIRTYEEAVSSYNEGSSYANAGNTVGLIGVCREQIWNLEGQDPDAEPFALTIESYDKGQAMMASAPISAVEMRRMLLLSLIKFGAAGVMKKPKNANITRIPDLSEHINLAETLFAEERHSLSALGDRDSLIAKQNLQCRERVRDLYNTALQFYKSSGRNRELWDWVQRGKAQSVSDILALGINLPVKLRTRIEADSQACELLKQEKELVAKIEAASADQQFLLKKTWTLLQERMRDNIILREVLSLRGGEAVTLSRLQDVQKQISARHQSRRTWYVDWMISGKLISLLIASDSSQDYHAIDTSISLDEVHDWIRNNLLSDSDGPDDIVRSACVLDDNIDSFIALAELCPLVQPLLDLTNEGDLLVLCPSGPLHRIPIHAAIIEGDPDDDIRTCKPLIERNPVVYTSSLTIFEQTMRRTIDRAHYQQSSPRSQDRGAIVAVFEDPTEHGLETVRDRVHQTAEHLSTTLSWPNVHCGRAANKTTFRTACESGIVHFIGHFHYDASNVLERGLVLAPTVAEDTNGPRQAMNDPERLFSVSEIFDTRVSASHFSLIACGSASQTIEPGDEPLGIVTALLCAGATSAIGTLWPIRVDSGREFSAVFYQNLFKEDRGDLEDGGGNVVDLAVAMQTAVKRMREDSELASPYHWAPFVLYGSWLLAK